MLASFVALALEDPPSTLDKYGGTWLLLDDQVVIVKDLVVLISAVGAVWGFVSPLAVR